MVDVKYAAQWIDGYLYFFLRDERDEACNIIRYLPSKPEEISYKQKLQISYGGCTFSTCAPKLIMLSIPDEIKSQFI